MSATTRPAGGSAREAVLTILLVLVCFVVFLGVVRLTFPDGTTLRGLVQSDRGAPDLALRGARTLEGDGVPTREQGFATLSSTVRSVKDRPASAIDWRDSTIGRSLGDRHAIQTGKGSAATIRFSDRNSIRLTENSLVVLKAIDVEKDGSDRRATLVMLGGSLSGVFNAAGGETMSIAIETPHGTVHLQTGKGGSEEAEFQVTVAEDKTATVSVLRGSVELKTKDDSVKIDTRQLVTLREKGFSKPLLLPGIPVGQMPPAQSEWAYRSQPPVIEFRWNPVPDADDYHFVLATDVDLQEVVWEQVLETPRIDHGALAAGEYWWSVAARGDGGAGPMTAPRRFTLSQDQIPPPLVVDWPDVAIRSKTYRLTGQTESGASVFVKDQKGLVDDDGSFLIDVSLERGANVVVVESMDPVGNTKYESRIIRTEY